MFCPRLNHFIRLNQEGTIGKCGHMVNPVGFKTFNELDNKRIHGIIFKAGIKLIASAGYLIGANYESKGKLVDQSSLLMRPRVHSSNSVTFSLGYRFGGNNVASSTSTPAGRTNYNNPCRLFGACN